MSVASSDAAARPFSRYSCFLGSGGRSVLVRRSLDRLLERCERPIRHIGVAVSGGADSMALALLAGPWAKRRGVMLTAVTVDHRMRPEAAAEARQVAAWLRERGIDHETLTPPDPAKADPGRRQGSSLPGPLRWSRVHDMAPILTAHHADDRLETLLMRLEAGTGVDGVAGPRGYTRLDGLDVVRPLLGVTKAALMATCRTHDQPWVEDPSNDDGSFTRVQIRKGARICSTLR